MLNKPAKSFLSANGDGTKTKEQIKNRVRSRHPLMRSGNRRLSTNTVQHKLNFAPQTCFFKLEINKVLLLGLATSLPGSSFFFHPLERGRGGKKADTAWERDSFCSVQRLTHPVCQLYDLSCWRSGRTWASFSCASVHWAELQKRKNNENNYNTIYTSLTFTSSNRGGVVGVREARESKEVVWLTYQTPEGARRPVTCPVIYPHLV